MKTLGTILITLLLLLSCKKDKVPPPCTGISMTGERELFVGTWHWYNTTVEEWFDVGSSVYHDYTPLTEGFNYYFTVSQDGLYKGYRNDTLVQDLILSNVDYEVFQTVTVEGMSFNVDCSEDLFDLQKFAFNTTDDSIYQFAYPLNFDDQVNHLRTGRNHFVKE